MLLNLGQNYFVFINEFVVYDVLRHVYWHELFVYLLFDLSGRVRLVETDLGVLDVDFMGF